MRERIGSTILRENVPEETAVSQGHKAAEKAIEESGKNRDEIGLLIFVTQNPDHGGLPHNSAILHGLLGLSEDCGCFDLGLGCSGYVYALSIAKAMLADNPKQVALVVTSDAYRKHLRPDDYSTNLLFGDAASATLLAHDGSFHLGGFQLFTVGKKASSLAREDGNIRMEGREVFNFSRRSVPKAIIDFLETRNIAVEDIDLFALHQGSKVIIEEIRKVMGVCERRMPVAIEGVGNTVSSSIPLIFQQRASDSGVENIVVAGFGVGLSYAVGEIIRNTNE